MSRLPVYFDNTNHISVVDSQVSLHVDVNPISPRLVSKFTLIGPDSKTGTYQRLIDEKLSNW